MLEAVVQSLNGRKTVARFEAQLEQVKHPQQEANQRDQQQDDGKFFHEPV